jgi:hypothetical protein
MREDWAPDTAGDRASPRHAARHDVQPVRRRRRAAVKVGLPTPRAVRMAVAQNHGCGSGQVSEPALDSRARRTGAERPLVLGPDSRLTLGWLQGVAVPCPPSRQSVSRIDERWVGVCLARLACRGPEHQRPSGTEHQR